LVYCVTLRPLAKAPARRCGGSTSRAGNTGSYHAIRGQHVPRYLAEFEYRFNRHYDLTAMIPRFLTVAARTPPMPYRLLKLAEPYT